MMILAMGWGKRRRLLQWKNGLTVKNHFNPFIFLSRRGLYLPYKESNSTRVSCRISWWVITSVLYKIINQPISSETIFLRSGSTLGSRPRIIKTRLSYNCAHLRTTKESWIWMWRRVNRRQYGFWMKIFLGGENFWVKFCWVNIF